MTALRRLSMVLTGTLAICTFAMAQEDAETEPVTDDLELTMTLLPVDAEHPEGITRTIELPPAASARGNEASQQGRDTANTALENREAGLETAAEARERGQEFGEEMAEQARENREDAGRGGPPTDPPGPPDDVPGPPDNPGNN